MKCLILSVVSLGLALSSLHAQTLTDTWSGAGAWTPASQPDFTSTSGGVLYTDAAIAAGTNSSATNTDATLSLGALSQGGNIFASSYLYTGGSTPAFTLATSNLLTNLKTITLTLDAAYGTFASDSVTLSLAGSLVSFNPVDTGSTAAGFEVNAYTWTWDVSSAGPADSLTLSWTTPAQHTAYTSVELTQSIQATPEPSTWALMILGAAGLAFYVKMRRPGVRIG